TPVTGTSPSSIKTGRSLRRSSRSCWSSPAKARAGAGAQGASQFIGAARSSGGPLRHGGEALFVFARQRPRSLGSLWAVAGGREKFFPGRPPTETFWWFPVYYQAEPAIRPSARGRTQTHRGRGQGHRSPVPTRPTRRVRPAPGRVPGQGVPAGLQLPAAPGGRAGRHPGGVLAGGAGHRALPRGPPL